MKGILLPDMTLWNIWEEEGMIHIFKARVFKEKFYLKIATRILYSFVKISNNTNCFPFATKGKKY